MPPNCKIAALGDAGYQGVEKREENKYKTVTWHVAMKRSKRKALPKDKLARIYSKNWNISRRACGRKLSIRSMW